MQHFSCHAMQCRFADQILMLPYERLVRDPARHFERLLRFLGISLHEAGKREGFAKAINSTTSPI